MRFIKAWSYACANQIMLQLDESHEKRRVYYYGFQVIIGGTAKLVLLTVLSLLMGAFVPALIVAVVFATLRVSAGGYHMDTYGKCMAASLALFLSAALVARYTAFFWSAAVLAAFLVGTCGLAVLVCIRYAPSDNPNRPITGDDEIRKFKRTAITTVIALSVILVVLLAYAAGDFKSYILAGCFGILLEAFTVTPIGHRFFEWIKKPYSFTNKG